MRILNRYGIRSLVRDMLFPIITGVILFAAAGTLDWLWGWGFCLLYLTAFLVMDLLVMILNPGLLNERGKRKPDIRWWDLATLLVGVIALLGIPLVAGLDKRFNWTTDDAAVVSWFGVLLVIASFGIVTPAMVVNPFFEATVRVEKERGHHVIAAGPYRYIRHPGYAGAILFYIAMPLLLTSWVAVVPAVIGIISYIIRTELEDRTLQNELIGYHDYVQRVRYRLLPGIW
jgi:protein-S-isoprenylcysteine O-methyltransferase Ste14